MLRGVVVMAKVLKYKEDISLRSVGKKSDESILRHTSSGIEEKEESVEKKDLSNKTPLPDREQSYKCESCGKVYNYEKSYKKHVLLHKNADYMWNNDEQLAKEIKLTIPKHETENVNYTEKAETCLRKQLKFKIRDRYKRRNYTISQILLQRKRRYGCRLLNQRDYRGEIKFYTEIREDHLGVHSDKIDHGCPTCSEKFANKKDLEHFVSKAKTCNHSTTTNTKRSKMAFSETSKNSVDNLSCVCAICDEVFDSSYQLQNHLQVHSLGNFCKVLDPKNNFQFMTHLSDSSLVCTICCKQYKQKVAFEKHVQSHSSPKSLTSMEKSSLSIQSNERSSDESVADLDRKKTLNSDSVMYRILTSTPYSAAKRVDNSSPKVNVCTRVCDFCEKDFKRKDELDRHLLEHIIKYPYSCDQCTEKFVTKWDLDRHLLITHRAKEPHVCHICNVGFPEDNRLRKHLLLHTRTQQFVCEICNKGFALKSVLRMHFQRHIADRSFVCRICFKGFAFQSNLNNHLLIHKRLKSPTF